MAHSLSAKKRNRQNIKRRARNRSIKSALKTEIKKYLKTTKESKDLVPIEQELRQTQKKIDQLIAKGAIHKNTAARKKSQLARQLNKIKDKTE